MTTRTPANDKLDALALRLREAEEHRRSVEKELGVTLMSLFLSGRKVPASLKAAAAEECAAREAYLREAEEGRAARMSELDALSGVKE